MTTPYPHHQQSHGRNRQFTGGSFSSIYSSIRCRNPPEFLAFFAGYCIDAPDIIAAGGTMSGDGRRAAGAVGRDFVAGRGCGMSAKHTTGPWFWDIGRSGRVTLATPDRGRLFVMGFERKGMQGATPNFSHWSGIEAGLPRERKGGIMQGGVLLPDGRMHPDARLIAAAPEMLEALKLYMAWVEAEEDHGKADFYQRMQMCRDADAAARAAIAKATGAQPKEQA